MKMISFMLTVTLQLAAAVAGFLVLLLALNGFSESEATPSLIFYIVGGVLSAVALGFASSWIANRFVERKSFGKVGATALTVIVLAIIGWVVLMLVSIIAVALAGIVHGMR
jgi:hypothetical protein